jgi:hypothetical protein
MAHQAKDWTNNFWHSQNFIDPALPGKQKHVTKGRP